MANRAAHLYAVNDDEDDVAPVPSACMHADLDLDSDAKGMHACDSFDELAASVGLRGPNIALCRSAFRESEDGFRLCIGEALRRSKTSPAGLLVRMVRDGDHRRSRVKPGSTSEVTNLARAEAWVEKTAWRLPPEHAHDMLHDYGLDQEAFARLATLIDRHRAEQSRAVGVTETLLRGGDVAC